MSGEQYSFDAELWRWEARTDSWVFVSLPEDASDEIDAIPRPPSGFGAVKVIVTIGSSTWSTSVFPDAGRRAYVLPLKKAVRAKQGLEIGDVASITVELV